MDASVDWVCGTNNIKAGAHTKRGRGRGGASKPLQPRTIPRTMLRLTTSATGMRDSSFEGRRKHATLARRRGSCKGSPPIKDNSGGVPFMSPDTKKGTWKTDRGITNAQKRPVNLCT